MQVFYAAFHPKRTAPVPCITLEWLSYCRDLFVPLSDFVGGGLPLLPTRRAADPRTVPSEASRGMDAEHCQETIFYKASATGTSL